MDITALLADTSSRKGFRAKAVAESVALLRANPGVEPEEIGRSLCLPTDVDDGSKWRLLHKPLRRAAMIFAIYPLGLGIGMLIIANDGAKFDTTVFPVVFVFLGIALLMISTPAVTRLAGHEQYQEWLNAELPTRRFAPFEAPEEARQQVMMVTPDRVGRYWMRDFAFLTHDAATGRVIIEGLHYRYIIRAEDVGDIGLIRFNKGAVDIRLRFQVGTNQEMALRITLVPNFHFLDTVWDLAKIREQTPACYRRMCATLRREPSPVEEMRMF